jgi:hypothetical protein
VLAVGCLATTIAVATVRIGPYESAACHIQCRPDRSIFAVTELGVFASYLKDYDVDYALSRSGTGVLFVNGQRTWACRSRGRSRDLGFGHTW